MHETADDEQPAGSASGCRMHYTQFPQLLRSDVWDYSAGSWAELVERFEAWGHRSYIEKERAPLWAPIRIKEGGRRQALEVLEVSALVLDLDHATWDQIEAVFVALAEDRLAFFWHTSHSHNPPDDCRIRVVVPLAEPVMARAFLPIWRAGVTRYAPAADPKCKDVCRAYFLPTHAPDAEGFDFGSHPGRALETTFVSDSPLALVPTPGSRILDREVLVDLARRWKRSTRAGMMDLAKRLERLAVGEPYAVQGERDHISFLLAERLVEAFPDLSPQVTADTFAQSLVAMGLDPPDSHVARIRAKLERAQRTRQEQQAAIEASETAARQDAIAQVFGGDRDQAYTQDELGTMAEKLGVTQGQLTRSWILQHDSDYYVLGPDLRFHRVSSESLVNNCRVLLAPAPIDLYVVDSDRRRLRTVPELLERFSTPVAEVRRSLVAQHPTIDLRSRALTLPVAPQRPIEPKFSTEIDDWLCLLAGADYDLIQDWLALSVDLSRPLTALALIGAGGGGKSLFAIGLSRIWSTAGPADLETALGEFNSEVERSPVVFADETLPKDFRGGDRTAELRRLVQQTVRVSNAKYRQSNPLDGASRIVVASNSPNVFAIAGPLEAHDVSAIADRITYVQVSKDARSYLDHLGAREHIHPGWIEGDGFAAHVLWLAKNRPVRYVGRFGIPPQRGELMRLILVRSGIRSSLCEWLCRWILEPSRAAFPPDRTDCLRVVDDSVLVNLDMLLDFWDCFLRHERTPGTMAASLALEGLSSGRVAVPTETGERELAVVTRENLETWIEQTGLASVLHFREAFRRLEEA